MAKKAQHGGKRPGAGRKPAHPEGRTVTIAATVPEGLVERLLLSGSLEPREYEILWDGLDDDGNELKPGVHFLTLLADEVTERVKIIEN